MNASGWIDFPWVKEKGQLTSRAVSLLVSSMIERTSMFQRYWLFEASKPTFMILGGFLPSAYCDRARDRAEGWRGELCRPVKH